MSVSKYWIADGHQSQELLPHYTRVDNLKGKTVKIFQCGCFNSIRQVLVEYTSIDNYDSKTHKF